MGLMAPLEFLGCTIYSGITQVASGVTIVMFPSIRNEAIFFSFFSKLSECPITIFMHSNSLSSEVASFLESGASLVIPRQTQLTNSIEQVPSGRLRTPGSTLVLSLSPLLPCLRSWDNIPFATPYSLFGLKLISR